jgi:hypothetical protein
LSKKTCQNTFPGGTDLKKRQSGVFLKHHEVLACKSYAGYRGLAYTQIFPDGLNPPAAVKKWE